MEYKIVSVNSVDMVGTNFESAAVQLAQIVTRELAQGWKPQGGVAIGQTRTTHEPYLFQALIKESPKA